jgi:5-(carboxyamino)imidazole ribonucleotide mutase
VVAGEEFMQADTQVMIVMGSNSDLPVMREASDLLRQFKVPCEIRISSAHRSPALTAKLAAESAGRGVRVIIAGAGMAAHLAGVIASETILPVIGVPLPGSSLNGVDALYSTVQMPGGIPVATMAIGKAGAKNAAILAVQILALSDAGLAEALRQYRHEMALDVERRDAALQAARASEDTD